MRQLCVIEEPDVGKNFEGHRINNRKDQHLYLLLTGHKYTIKTLCYLPHSVPKTLYQILIKVTENVTWVEDTVTLMDWTNL